MDIGAQYFLNNTAPNLNFVIFCKIWQNWYCSGRAFFWTFNSSVAIKWLSYIYILRFRGGRTNVFKFGAVIEKILGTYVHFATFLTSQGPPLLWCWRSTCESSWRRRKGLLEARRQTCICSRGRCAVAAKIRHWKSEFETSTHKHTHELL